MPQIQPVHEVLSLFGIATKSPGTTKKAIDRGLVVSLLGAFFIVLATGIILSFVSKNFALNSQAAAPTAINEERTAFQPGQFVSAEISRGYLGNYR